MYFSYACALPIKVYMQHRDPTKGRFGYTDPDAELDDADDDWGQDESDFDPAHEPPPEQQSEDDGGGSDSGDEEKERDSDPLGEFPDGFDGTFDGPDSSEVEGEEEDTGESDKDRWIKLEKFLRAKDLEG